jgi:hypothetical protein
MSRLLQSLFPCLLAGLYAAVLLGFQAENVSLGRSILVANHKDTHSPSEATPLAQSAIHAEQRRCIHHAVSCPPGCHCPALVEDAQASAHRHDASEEAAGVEGASEENFLPDDKVWRPCASLDDGLSSWDLPWQLPSDAASMASRNSVGKWYLVESADVLKMCARGIDKVPIG